jgi:phage terminase large subunit-like protein|nr:MAG TPA: Large Terminase [Caudoviricetes sp.]
MLSNTAVPKYYGEFRGKVLRGEIPVCKELSMEMNRIDALIDDPDMYYDDEAIDGWIRFCENELTLTNGEDVELLDTFKLWGEQLWGWYRFVERSVYIPNEDGIGGHHKTQLVKERLTKKQYIIVARGAAKSMYAAFWQIYWLTMDTATTHQVTTAPTMPQAVEVMSPIKTAITRHRGPLFKMLTYGSLQNTTGSRALRQQLVSTKKGIENLLTGSLLEIRPMTIDKLQGLRSKYNSVDEWLSGDVREDVVGAIEQGASKNKGYAIIAISSEGTVRNGSGDAVKMELQKILRGESYQPHVSIWHYKLDSVSEVADPSRWVKAQPTIGITVSYETYYEDVERAEASPAARNDILAKRFGLPLEGFTYFFTYEETLPHRPHDFWKMPCSLGADLSRGDDFCAFTFLFPLADGSFGVKTRAYITQYTLDKLHASIRSKYDEFIQEGTLIVMPGTVLDVAGTVYDDLEKHIEEREYDVRSFGFDPFNAKEFVAKWERDYGPYAIETVIQGARTESVPLGELKKFAEKRELIFDEAIMSFCMGNTVTMEDTNANRKLTKRRNEAKIDCVAAMMDAYVAFKLHKEDFE